MIYNGESFVSPEIKKLFPNARVNAHQGRDALGKCYLNTLCGKNALFPDPFDPQNGYFAGEEVPEPVQSVAVQKVEQPSAVAAKVEWKPEPPPVTLKVEPVNAAAKKNEGWTPAPPKKA